MNEHITKAREFAMTAHGDQKYGDMPYVAHLDQVASWLPLFGYDDTASSGHGDQYQVAYLHDVLEDTDVTEEDLRQAGFGEFVIEAVKFVTDEDGPNRKTRKRLTYRRMQDQLLDMDGPVAHTVGRDIKVADRLANLSVGLGTQNYGLLKMYLKERDTFWLALLGSVNYPWWQEYESLMDEAQAQIDNRKRKVR